MSDVTTRSQTNNQLFSDFDFSKLFLFDNKFEKVTVANSSGSDLTITAGQLIGVVGVTYQKYKSGTSNISFKGIAAETVTIAGGSSYSLTVCVGGKIAEEKIVLDGTDTLATIVSNRSIRDIIQRDSIDIQIEASSELSAGDNY